MAPALREGRELPARIEARAFRQVGAAGNRIDRRLQDHIDADAMDMQILDSAAEAHRPGLRFHRAQIDSVRVLDRPRHS